MMTEFFWSSFHFLRPHMLWLLIPAAVLLYSWLNNTSRQDGWQQSCDPELLQAMQIQSAGKATRWNWLYWPITLISILALAGPAVRQMPVPMVKNQSALIVALDVSKSMLSDDLKPSRLQRAKFKIQDLLENRKDGQTALVVYSGDAFVVTPLTDDTETIVSLLDVIDPSIMPVSGTNTVVALDKAADLLTQAGVNKGQILLVTDSIDMYKTEDRLSEVNDTGVTIHVLAVGTAEGAPIPTNQGFLKDLRGQIVIPQVDYSSLQQAAKIGQGRFSVLSNSLSENQLYEVNPENNHNDSTEDDTFDEQGGESYIDDGPLLALLIIPLLALLYRRGILMVLCVGFMLNSETSYALSWDEALSWDNLWLNKDQQAFRQLETAPAEAYNQAENQQIKAAAAYKKQDFKAAKNLYPENGETLNDYYNRGNALAQAGDFENALKSYDLALTFDPEDEDTLYNKNIVEQALQQQQEQQEQQQNQENQENQDSEQNQQDQQQESSEQERQEQQQQAQQDQQAEADQQQGEQEEQTEEQQAQQQEQAEEQQQEIELTPEEKALDAEEKQAMEQWLRRIKDDPGGLMRRKFLYQYHKRNQDGESYDNQTTEDW